MYFLFIYSAASACGTQAQELRYTCGILVPQPRIKSVSPASGGRFLNHWTTREVPTYKLKCSSSVQLSSVTQSCPTLCDPMDCCTPGLPVHYQLLEFTQSIELVMPSSHLILCHPLLLLPSIFPSIRIFSNESVLQIRWPKYWSFSFNISPSNEHLGLISFRMDWLVF